MPLEGKSSPVVWNDRVFLTGATVARREVYCFDTNTGQLLWQRLVPGAPESTTEPPKVSRDTGYAAPTPTTDGQRVYAIFANGDVVALDFAGQVLWTKSLGIPQNAYGHAASLAMHQNLVLIQFDQGAAEDKLSRLLAVNGPTGEMVWATARQVPNSWSSPIVIDVAGRAQIVTAADPWVIAYDLATGKEIWRAKCLRADIGPSPVFANGIVYVASEFPALSAIRADGTGDVTQTHLLWSGEESLPDTASPLATNQFVFTLASYGVLTCYDCRTGEMLWDEEFEGSDFSSSPSLVGRRLYLFSKSGKGWVVEPTRDGCQRLSESNLREECVASPAFHAGRVYIRGSKHLFCLGKQ